VPPDDAKANLARIQRAGAAPDSLIGMPRPRLLRLFALVEELQHVIDLTLTSGKRLAPPSQVS
jgi:hypothetical protein